MIAAGWYGAARRVDAHRGRVGGPIVAETFVIHTTDCMPGSMPAIVKSWSTTAGNGACAHGILGRSATDGLVQMIPFDRNGNHAGGTPRHGWYRDVHAAQESKTLVHPNTIAIGIELDCAGYLGRQVNGKWIHPDTKREVAPADVDVDEHGRGWHKLTSYQYDQLALLLDEVLPTLAPMHAGLTLAPNGGYVENGVPWASTSQARVVGHVTLDPTNKTDPGPFVMAWIRKRYEQPHG